MVYITRRTRRRLLSQCIILLIFFLIYFVVLPRDSPIRLAINFNGQRLVNTVRGATSDRDAWLRADPPYPIDLYADVGYLIKTGYGTRRRVPEQLAAFEAAGGFLRQEGQNFLVVGDWTTVNETDAEAIGVPVHDAIQKVLETKIRGKMEDYPRLMKHRSLQEQLEAGNETKALQIGQDFGWELDAVKFIMGMEMIQKKMPYKKWYIILDDDTFLIRPSLELLLSHLDPKKPQYIGNAVGDYKGRFAHGGSAILISGVAMRELFQRPEIVEEAYVESMSETWGDRLVATTLQKLGIYIEEAYSHHFNGEPPSITRIRSDRFCSPLVSFHGLRRPGEMLQVGKTLAKVNDPVLWRDVWELFGQSPLSALGDSAVRLSVDHVGKPDEQTRTWGGVKNTEACQAKCEEHKRWCLAWTYELGTKRCNISPWFVLKADDAKQKASGVNWPKVQNLLGTC
ncbi:hypothetical protein BGZ63DRAFT_348322 [Mariannaea sp. PMI_226]|nr:hypothetical protein BGZ63DRAFT_348322 [Mariannaea sp. PMI_226]